MSSATLDGKATEIEQAVANLKANNVLDEVKAAKDAGVTSDDVKAMKVATENSANPSNENNALLRSAAIALGAAPNALDPAIQAMAFDFERYARDGMRPTDEGFRIAFLQELSQMQARAQQVQQTQESERQPAAMAALKEEQTGTRAESVEQRRVGGEATQRY